MSLLRRALGLDRAATDGPLDVNAPLPDGTAADSESVRRIATRLTALPPARARFVAAFAYLLSRAAQANLVMTEAETAEVTRQVMEVGGLDAEAAGIVALLAGTRAADFGATEDYLVTREFKAISTMDERLRLVRCCLLVMAADEEVDATEAWLVNRLAEELDVERPDLNRIRAEFHDRITGIKELRRFRAG